MACVPGRSVEKIEPKSRFTLIHVVCTEHGTIKTGGE